MYFEQNRAPLERHRGREKVGPKTDKETERGGGARPLGSCGAPVGSSAVTDAAVRTCYRHPGNAAGVVCQRCDRPICPQCMNQASVGFHCPECARTGAQKVVRGPGAGLGRPVVTLSLIVLNVLVWGIAAGPGRRHQHPRHPGEGHRPTAASLASGVRVMLGGQPIGDLMAWRTARRTASLPWLPARGHHPPRRLTCGALWILGQVTEQALGRSRMVMVYFVPLFAGSFGARLLAPPRPAVGRRALSSASWAGSSWWPGPAASGCATPACCRARDQPRHHLHALRLHLGGRAISAGSSAGRWPPSSWSTPRTGALAPVAAGENRRTAPAPTADRQGRQRARSSSAFVTGSVIVVANPAWHSRRSIGWFRLTAGRRPQAPSTAALSDRRFFFHTRRSTGLPANAPTGPPSHHGNRSRSVQVKRARSPAAVPG